MEQVLLGGDLKSLSPEQRVSYYRRVCESLGLNPLTKPFDYITLNGRLTLYAKRDATDQLRKRHGISVRIASREQVGDLYVVTASATDKDARTDESVGAVSTVGLKGEALANAIMKAETKAKRRVTLSIAGLGWLDETETDTVPGARHVAIDTDTGEIKPGAESLAAVPSVSPSQPTAPATIPHYPPSPAPDRKREIARLNKAFVGAGLSKDDLRDRARQMFGRPEIQGIDDLTTGEVGFLADEVEQLVAATKGSA
jgi:hypothetical protein